MESLLYRPRGRWVYGKEITHLELQAGKVEIILEQRQVAFLSPGKVCENLNFKRCTVEKFKFLQILLVDKNATSLCSKNISTLLELP